MIPTRMNPLLRILINFGISVLLFWFFQSIGWFEITDTMPLWAVVLIVGVLNVLVGIAVGFLMVIFAPVIVIIITCTLGLGLFLVGPLSTYLVFYLTSSITELFTMSTIWWQIFIIGAAFGWLQLTAAKD